MIPKRECKECQKLRGQIARCQAAGDYQARQILQAMLISGVKPKWVRQEIRRHERVMQAIREYERQKEGQ